MAIVIQESGNLAANVAMHKDPNHAGQIWSVLRANPFAACSGR